MAHEIVANPFGAPAHSSTALAATDQQRAIAEVQAAMVVARTNPRDQQAAMDRILVACQRPGLASQAVYQYARGGTDITGPSIRLAEAVALAWGNLQFGIRELEQANGESTVQAYAWDVETNTRREMTFQVPHVRYTKRGAKALNDPRDIYEMVANQGARRLRACILSVVPGDVIEAAVEQCEETMKAKVDTSPEAIQKVLRAFEALGVSKAQIEARIQRRIESITPAQYMSLGKIRASIKDGMSTVQDWFDDAGAGPAENAAPALPDLPEDKLYQYVDAISKGQATATAVLASIRTRYNVSGKQEALLKHTKKAEQAAPAPVPAPPPPADAQPDEDGVIGGDDDDFDDVPF